MNLPELQQLSRRSGLPEKVLEEACDWLLDQWSGTLSEAEFVQWYQASTDHRQAWDYLNRLASRLDTIAGPAAATTLRRNGVSPGRRQLLLGLASLALGAGLLEGMTDRPVLRSALADEQTGVGEQKRLTLADNTRLMLNTGTAINLSGPALAPSLALIAGELQMQADPSSSPSGIIVQAGAVTAQCRGGRICVRRYPDGAVRIAVFEGAATVAGAGTNQTLNPGQSLTLMAGAEPRVGAAGYHDAWTRGVFVAEQLPLSAVVAELARYRSGILRVDPAVASLSVSGTLPVLDTEQALAALQSALPVEVRSVTSLWVTITAAKKRSVS